LVFSAATAWLTFVPNRTTAVRAANKCRCNLARSSRCCASTNTIGVPRAAATAESAQNPFGVEPTLAAAAITSASSSAVKPGLSRCGRTSPR